MYPRVRRSCDPQQAMLPSLPPVDPPRAFLRGPFGRGWRTMTLFATAILLLVQEDWREACRQFENFSTLDQNQRLSAIRLLGAHDRKEAAEKLVRIFDVVQKGLENIAPEKAAMWREMEQMPPMEEATPSNLPSAMRDPEFQKKAKKWEQFKSKEEAIQKKILEWEEVYRAAVAALGGFRNDETVQWMAEKMKTGTDANDREGLARAFARVQNAAAVPALIDRVDNDARWTVRVAAINSLTERKAPEASEAVRRALSSKEWPVVISALDYIEAMADKTAIPDLIEALRGAQGRVQHEINAVLVKLTGEDKHGNYELWKEWWGKNEQAFVKGEYKPEGKPEIKGGKGSTGYYGIPIESKRIIFVCDKSGSMEEPSDWKPGEGEIQTGSKKDGDSDKPEGTQKWHIAKFELRRAIRGLTEDTLFTIIVYAEEVDQWQPTLVPATPKNKKEALKWVDAIKIGGGTNLFDAIERAFQTLGPAKDPEKNTGADTIYVMSDGRPNKGQISDTNAICAKVKEMNATRKIKIHAIALGKADLQKTEDGKGVDPDFMKKLAEENDGTFVWRK